MAKGAVSDSLEMSRQALDIDPLSVPVNAVRGWLLYCAGRYEEAAAQCRKTAELEMNHPAPHFYLSLVYEKLGRTQEAITEAKQAVAASNGLPVSRMLLARAYAVGNSSAEASALLQELESLAGKAYLSTYYMALVYAAMERYDDTFKWLDRGCNEGEAWTYFAAVDPRLSHLRCDPRFADLLSQMPLNGHHPSER
jgi:tetratricopeptide (TPR) repeat protein